MLDLKKIWFFSDFLVILFLQQHAADFLLPFLHLSIGNKVDTPIAAKIKSTFVKKKIIRDLLKAGYLFQIKVKQNLKYLKDKNLIKLIHLPNQTLGVFFLVVKIFSKVELLLNVIHLQVLMNYLLNNEIKLSKIKIGIKKPRCLN